MLLFFIAGCKKLGYTCNHICHYIIWDCRSWTYVELMSSYIWVSTVTNVETWYFCLCLSNCSNTLITVGFTNESDCIRQGGLTSGDGEKLPHPSQQHPINNTNAHMHKQCSCRRRVTWPRCAECLSQLISFGVKWRLVEVVLYYSWSLTRQEAHSSVHPQQLGKPPSQFAGAQHLH